MCFICGKLCSRSRKQEWSMVESSIDLSSKSIFAKVNRAANERKAEAMLLRLSEVPNGNLVAIEARYHRKKSCIASYLNLKSIEATTKNVSETQTRYDEVLNELMTEVRSNIVEQKQVYLLSTLLSRFVERLAKSNGPNAQQYRSQLLKAKLISKYPELSFIPQTPYSDLVCSAEITVGDALRKAEQLLNVIQQSEEAQIGTSSSSAFAKQAMTA
ncbi:unnamed protein product [Mytilus coruscus]|uniref:Uncharacterized protein n=1 Tax=Mytilus coruscus TaxID=42192 RepID=A0A6J8A356_MYTCO|nr:unnamed protein product [Mytilus coruscus]